jgi:peptidoglycan/LPS O-acetylase OafA/YrhL
MLFLGRISFALYLTHTTVLELILWLDKQALGGVLLAHSPWLVSTPSAIVAIAVAALLYLMVEDPARHFIMRRRRASVAPPPAGAVGPLA